MKKLNVTIRNLQQIKNGVACGAKVEFKVIQAGRVLMERIISGKTCGPFTISYDVSADDEPLVVEHDRPDIKNISIIALLKSPTKYDAAHPQAAEYSLKTDIVKDVVINDVVLRGAIYG
ncbi:hypothetical protein [Klebsiella variicola]|uniref:hypothetical protein n=1 Tax=Klebsiella variicola TaxID=244366 RepID=UPI000A9E5391|nr:hypothetical protein [Klebsiella variicola]